jgi:hypothetical protein
VIISHSPIQTAIPAQKEYSNTLVLRQKTGFLGCLVDVTIPFVLVVVVA